LMQRNFKMVVEGKVKGEDLIKQNENFVRIMLETWTK